MILPKNAFKFLVPGAQMIFLGSVALSVWLLRPEQPFLPKTSVDRVDLGHPPTEVRSWEEYVAVFRGRKLFSPVERQALAFESRISFRLAGILLGGRSSVLLEKGDGQIVVLSEGDRQEDIFLKEIDGTLVSLEVAGKETIMELEKQTL